MFWIKAWIFKYSGLIRPEMSMICLVNAGFSQAISRRADAVGLLDMDPGNFLDFWQCAACTYANQDLDATTCEVCNEAR